MALSRPTAAVVVPWVALAAMTAFAIAQLRARREAECAAENVVPVASSARESAAPAAAKAASVATPPVAAAPSPSPPVADAAAEAAVLRAELRSTREAAERHRALLSAAEGRVAALVREREDAVRRAQDAEAARRARESAAEARDVESRAAAAALDVRARAAEAVRAALEERLKTIGAERDEARNELAQAAERIADLERRQEMAAASARAENPTSRGQDEHAEGSVEAWIDALQEDGEDARTRTRAWAAAATEEDLAALRREVALKPRRVDLFVAMLDALPPSASASALAGDVLLVAEEPSEGLARVLARHPPRGRALRRALDAAPAAALALLPAWAESAPPEERDGVVSALREGLDAPRPTAVIAAALSLARVGEPGGAPALLEVLDEDDPAVRAAAGHALSRAPDLRESETGARHAALALLRDGDERVRAAGVRLAEALLGESVAFDPAAAPEEREAAIEALAPRLTP
jgi:hypothetical protein